MGKKHSHWKTKNKPKVDATVRAPVDKDKITTLSKSTLHGVPHTPTDKDFFLKSGRSVIAFKSHGARTTQRVIIFFRHIVTWAQLQSHL